MKFQALVPGAHGLDHVVLDGPNHFIQHDAPDDLVRIIDAFVGAYAQGALANAHVKN